MTLMNTRVTTILAVLGTAASLSSAYSQNYTISSKSTSFSVPSGWPNYKYDQYTNSKWKPAPPDVNWPAGTPLLLCTSGEHYNTDTKGCGDANNPSQPYGIGIPPTIGIGVAFPSARVNGLTGIQIMFGDSSCAKYANQQNITNWWEYKITSVNPSSPALLFTAAVALMQGPQDAYYAELTNCNLTSSSTAKSK